MSEIKKCLFCDENAEFKEVGALNQDIEISCHNCGKYKVSDIFADQDEEIVKRYLPYKHLISGLIREKNDLGLQLETITTKNIDSLINDSMIPKTIMQKLDKILLHYYRKTKTFGLKFNCGVIAREYMPYSIGYCSNHPEFLKMIIELGNLGLFEVVRLQNYSAEYCLTIEGMTRAEELLSTNKYSNKVFVAMGFKNDLLDAMEQAIKPACKECGFQAFLVSEVEHNGDITDKIIAEIKTSKFVITDFTYNNQGAYFEAGYAQGRGLEVIRTCKKQWLDGKDAQGNKNHLHFDINHYNFILWESYEDLKEKLVNRIRASIIK